MEASVVNQCRQRDILLAASLLRCSQNAAAAVVSSKRNILKTTSSENDIILINYFAIIKGWKRKAGFFSINKNIYVQSRKICEIDLTAREKELGVVIPSQIKTLFIELGESNINNDIQILPLEDMAAIKVDELTDYISFANDSNGRFLAFDINDPSKSKIYYIDTKLVKGILASETLEAIVGLVSSGRQAFSKLFSTYELCELGS